MWSFQTTGPGRGEVPGAGPCGILGATATAVSVGTQTKGLVEDVGGFFGFGGAEGEYGSSATARDRGRVATPGPFDVGTVEQALAERPNLRSTLVGIARDCGDDPSNWSLRDLAVTAVHGAHGGRDGNVDAGCDSRYRQALSAAGLDGSQPSTSLGPTEPPVVSEKESSLDEAIDRAIQRIADTGRNVVTSTVEGAARGAAGATEGAARGSRVGGRAALGIDTNTLLIAGAALVAVFLLSR